MIRELNDRTRQILKLAIDAYIQTGEPVGSLAISQKPGISLSPATIRHILAELEDKGLLYAPHTSAGRLPTEAGMTVFVESLLEVDTLSAEDQSRIKRQVMDAHSMTGLLEKASTALSEFSSCASLVFAPKSDDGLRQIEFVHLSPGRAIAVIVFESGQIENRLIDVPPAVTAAILQRASNYLNAQLSRQKISEKLDLLRQ
ncbi:MAG: heat-inducible transcriptional repressor HrcA, partial [Bdellovibrionales bacterium]